MTIRKRKNFLILTVIALSLLHSTSTENANSYSAIFDADGNRKFHLVNRFNQWNESKKIILREVKLES